RGALWPGRASRLRVRGQRAEPRRLELPGEPAAPDLLGRLVVDRRRLEALPDPGDDRLGGFPAELFVRDPNELVQRAAQRLDRLARVRPAADLRVPRGRSGLEALVQVGLP